MVIASPGSDQPCPLADEDPPLTTTELIHLAGLLGLTARPAATDVAA